MTLFCVEKAIVVYLKKNLYFLIFCAGHNVEFWVNVKHPQLLIKLCHKLFLRKPFLEGVCCQLINYQTIKFIVLQKPNYYFLVLVFHFSVGLLHSTTNMYYIRLAASLAGNLVPAIPRCRTLNQSIINLCDKAHF